MNIAEEILSAIIKEREKDIVHFRALLKLTQDDVMRLRKAGDELAISWAKVCTDNDYHDWKDAVAEWDNAKENNTIE